MKRYEIKFGGGSKLVESKFESDIHKLMSNNIEGWGSVGIMDALQYGKVIQNIITFLKRDLGEAIDNTGEVFHDSADVTEREMIILKKIEKNIRV